MRETRTMTVAEVIYHRRKAMGLTQKELGLLCGYGPQSAERVVQLWEHEKQPIPPARLRKIAKAMQLPLDMLLP